MQVESELVEQTIGTRTKLNSYSLHDEAVAWARLFERKFIGPTSIGVLMMFFQRKFSHLINYISFLSFCIEWSGINAFLYYGPTLVHDIGLRGDIVILLVAGGIGIMQFIAVLPAIVYIDRVGRKPLLRGTCWFLFYHYY
jgi:Sugar (and other) transporter